MYIEKRREEWQNNSGYLWEVAVFFIAYFSELYNFPINNSINFF